MVRVIDLASNGSMSTQLLQVDAEPRRQCKPVPPRTDTGLSE
jgi:hypothetical protein